MKLLLDACVWGGVQEHLRALGHDVTWAGEWLMDPGDNEILARAYAENRILVTLDKDFGELAIRHGAPSCGIVRLVDIVVRKQGEICLHVIEKYQNELSSGAIITVEPNRVRIRLVD